MTTPSLQTAKHIHARLQEHLQELHQLLSDVRRRGLTQEEAQVRDAIACLQEKQLLPAPPGSFPALAMARQRCLRDVCRLRESSRPTILHTKRPPRTGRPGMFGRLFSRAAKAA